MDKVAGDRNAATEDLDVFAVVTVEPIFGPSTNQAANRTCTTVLLTLEFID